MTEVRSNWLARSEVLSRTCTPASPQSVVSSRVVSAARTEFALAFQILRRDQGDGPPPFDVVGLLQTGALDVADWAESGPLFGLISVPR